MTAQLALLTPKDPDFSAQTVGEKAVALQALRERFPDRVPPFCVLDLAALFGDGGPLDELDENARQLALSNTVQAALGVDPSARLALRLSPLGDRLRVSVPAVEARLGVPLASGTAKAIENLRRQVQRAGGELSSYALIVQVLAEHVLSGQILLDHQHGHGRHVFIEAMWGYAGASRSVQDHAGFDADRVWLWLPGQSDDDSVAIHAATVSKKMRAHRLGDEGIHLVELPQSEAFQSVNTPDVVAAIMRWLEEAQPSLPAGPARFGFGWSEGGELSLTSSTEIADSELDLPSRLSRRLLPAPKTEAAPLVHSLLEETWASGVARGIGALGGGGGGGRRSPRLLVNLDGTLFASLDEFELGLQSLEHGEFAQHGLGLRCGMRTWQPQRFARISDRHLAGLRHWLRAAARALVHADEVTTHARRAFQELRLNRKKSARGRWDKVEAMLADLGQLEGARWQMELCRSALFALGRTAIDDWLDAPPPGLFRDLVLQPLPEPVGAFFQRLARASERVRGQASTAIVEAEATRLAQKAHLLVRHPAPFARINEEGARKTFAAWIQSDRVGADLADRGLRQVDRRRKAQFNLRQQLRDRRLGWGFSTRKQVLEQLFDTLARIERRDTALRSVLTRFYDRAERSLTALGHSAAHADILNDSDDVRHLALGSLRGLFLGSGPQGREVDIARVRRDLAIRWQHDSPYDAVVRFPRMASGAPTALTELTRTEQLVPSSVFVGDGLSCGFAQAKAVAYGAPMTPLEEAPGNVLVADDLHDVDPLSIAVAAGVIVRYGDLFSPQARLASTLNIPVVRSEERQELAVHPGGWLEVDGRMGKVRSLRPEETLPTRLQRSGADEFTRRVAATDPSVTENLDGVHRDRPLFSPRPREAGDPSGEG